MLKKSTTILLLCTSLMLCFGGCKSKQIFEVEGEEYTQVFLSGTELLNNTYYIKDGTKFVKTYLPKDNGTVKTSDGETSGMGSNKVFWFKEDYQLIPSYYANELIAYPSDTAHLEEVNIERFKEVGPSIGLYGATFNAETGYIDFSLKNNTISNSDIHIKLNDGTSDSIQLVTINDIPVTEEMLNAYGIITGMEQGKAYKIGYYAGTYFTSADIIADEFFIQSFESYTIDQATLTKNGYLSIQMPKDAKSGYYMVNNGGLFKYYNYNKGEFPDEEQNMNESYYENIEEQLTAFSQQYVAHIEKKTNDVMFEIYYDAKGYDEIDIRGILTAPNSNTYTLTKDTENNKLTILLKEAMAGRWTINISPKELVVTDIKTASARNSDETVAEKKDFAFSDPDENISFYAKYSGEGTIWGIIENEYGETQEMTVNERNQTLYYTYPYLKEGSYNVTIYHYNDTSVTEIDYKYDVQDQSVEIITVEE